MAIGNNWAIFTHLKAQPLLANEAFNISATLSQYVGSLIQGIGLL
jgi:hypothetical protein